MPPTLGNGEICHVEVPARDVARSADFYNKVFGWKVRRRGDGSTAFDDSVADVSGAFVTGRPPMSSVGLLIYMMVDSMAAKTEAVLANGGEIVQPIGTDAPEITRGFAIRQGTFWGCIRILREGVFPYLLAYWLNLSLGKYFVSIS